MKRISKAKVMTLAELDAKFPTEDVCKSYLQASRWPQGVTCPRCKHEKVYELSREYHWQCENCAADGYRFSVLVGTIFENSPIPLQQWFKVIYLMLSSKKGISALQIYRMMGFGSYRTAWSMCHRIRVALGEEHFRKLIGFVEIDETFVGGKAKNRHKDKRGGPGGTGSAGGRGIRGKAIIAGAVQRKGKVVARVIQSIDGPTLARFVREVVSDKVSLLCADEFAGYNSIRNEYPFGMVDHARGEYVCGSVHTNTIEGFWSMIKRGIMGTFHKVSPKYLPLYVKEFQFRYNNRDNANIFNTAIKAC
jgi:transposase-like protein